MTIDTKANVGDEIFVIFDNDIQKCKILDIKIITAETYTVEKYSVMVETGSRGERKSLTVQDTDLVFKVEGLIKHPHWSRIARAKAK